MSDGGVGRYGSDYAVLISPEMGPGRNGIQE